LYWLASMPPRNSSHEAQSDEYRSDFLTAILLFPRRERRSRQSSATSRSPLSEDHTRRHREGEEPQGFRDEEGRRMSVVRFPEVRAACTNRRIASALEGRSGWLRRHSSIWKGDRVRGASRTVPFSGWSLFDAICRQSWGITWAVQNRSWAKSLKRLVGVAGFEPATPSSRTRVATEPSVSPQAHRDFSGWPRSRSDPLFLSGFCRRAATTRLARPGYELRITHAPHPSQCPSLGRKQAVRFRVL
jgi:hypothetical protein